jgi:hypothetical protein
MKRITLSVLCLFSLNSYAGNYNPTRIDEMAHVFFSNFPNMPLMEKELNTNNENQSSQAIINDVMVIYNQLGLFSDFGNLYGQMKNSNDKNKIQAVIQKHQESLSVDCASFLKEIDYFLTVIKSPNLISYAKKSRDNIIKTCDIIKKWK